MSGLCYNGYPDKSVAKILKGSCYELQDNVKIPSFIDGNGHKVEIRQYSGGTLTATIDGATPVESVYAIWDSGACGGYLLIKEGGHVEGLYTCGIGGEISEDVKLADATVNGCPNPIIFGDASTTCWCALSKLGTSTIKQICEEKIDSNCYSSYLCKDINNPYFYYSTQCYLTVTSCNIRHKDCSLSSLSTILPNITLHHYNGLLERYDRDLGLTKNLGSCHIKNKQVVENLVNVWSGKNCSCLKPDGTIATCDNRHGESRTQPHPRLRGMSYPGNIIKYDLMLPGTFYALLDDARIFFRDWSYDDCWSEGDELLTECDEGSLTKKNCLSGYSEEDEWKTYCEVGQPHIWNPLLTTFDKSTDIDITKPLVITYAELEKCENGNNYCVNDLVIDDYSEDLKYYFENNTCKKGDSYTGGVRDICDTCLEQKINFWAYN